MIFHAISFALYLFTISLYLLAYQVYTIWPTNPLTVSIFFYTYGFYKLGVEVSELFFCAILWRLGEVDEDEIAPKKQTTERGSCNSSIVVEEMDDKEALN